MAQEKTFSDYMRENYFTRLRQAELRIEVIEEWLLVESFDHPDYQKMVMERNSLLVVINN